MRDAISNTLPIANPECNIVPNDRITVHVTRPAPGFFAKVFGINSVQVGATATAQTEGMSQAKYVAPIVVNKQHPLLAGAGCPCLDQKTTIPLGKAGAPGAFDLINLDGADSGPVRRFIIDNALMWLRDYHLDGLRLDAVHALVDSSVPHLLAELANVAR